MHFLASLLHASVVRSRKYPFDCFMSILEGLSVFALNYIFFSMTSENSVETILLVLLFQISNELFYGFFIDNITGMRFYINRGDLDWMVLKPVDCQLYISLRYMNFGHLLNACMALICLLMTFIQFPLHLSLASMIIAVFYILLSILNAYSLMIFSTSLSLLFSASGNVSPLILSITQMSKYPKRMYPGFLLPFLFIFLPVVLNCNNAKDALLGQFSLLQGILSGSITLLFLLITRVLFRKACDTYTGTGN